jgi:hypothetical protein
MHEANVSKNVKVKTLFSEVFGRVLHEGNPVRRQELRQYFSWLGEDSGTKVTFTDDNGYYHFPAVVSLRPEPRKEEGIFIAQKISTQYNGRTIMLWETTKYDFRDGGELGGYPIRVIHDLTGEIRSYVIPCSRVQRTSLEGVLKIDHPYVRELERGRARVSTFQGQLIQQLVTLLNTPRVLDLISRTLYHSLLCPQPITSVTGIVSPEFSGFALYRDADHTEATIENNRYVGFAIAGKLTVVDTIGVVSEVHMFWLKAAISLSGPAAEEPELEGDSGAIKIDPGGCYERSVVPYLQRGSIGYLIYKLITTYPYLDVAFALDDRLSVEDLVSENRGLPNTYEPDFRIAEFEVTRIRPSHICVEGDYTVVKTSGRLRVSGHPHRYRFAAYLRLSLTSLGEDRCNVEEARNHKITFHLDTLYTPCEWNTTNSRRRKRLRCVLPLPTCFQKKTYCSPGTRRLRASRMMFSG